MPGYSICTCHLLARKIRFLYFWEIHLARHWEVDMQGDYPRFKTTYTHEEFVEHFLLSPADRALIDTCHGDANRHGVAVLLKAVQYLGYFPEELQQVPPPVRTFLAHQLQLLWDHTEAYPRHPSTRDVHLALIRQHTGFRFPTLQAKQALETWLRSEGVQLAAIGLFTLIQFPYTWKFLWSPLMDRFSVPLLGRRR